MLVPELIAVLVLPTGVWQIEDRRERDGDPRGVRGAARRGGARRRRDPVGRRGRPHIRRHHRTLRGQRLQQYIGDVLLPAVAAG